MLGSSIDEHRQMTLKWGLNNSQIMLREYSNDNKITLKSQLNGTRDT
jgi:hypothetical protein